MKKFAAQLWLLGIFLLFFAIQIVLLLVCLTSNGIGPEQLKDLVVQLLTIYSVPLSIIIAGVFAKRHRTVRLNAIFYASVVLAMLWNFLFVWRTVELTLAAIDQGEDRAKYFSEYLDSVSKASTFLISGILSYYFAKTPEEIP